MAKVSIKDVARKAGVSISTVSRVLTSSAPVSEELKKKVEEAVQELGYSPSMLARSLRHGRTKTIGFILPDISNPFFVQIVRGAEDYLWEHGYTLIFGSSDQNRKKEDTILNTLLSKHIDGLLFTGTGESNPKLLRSIQHGLNVVFLDRLIKDVNVSYVVVDNFKGITMLVDYLVDTGHRNFIFINGDKNTFSAKQRHDAFISKMREYGLQHEHHYASFSYDAGYEFGKNITKSLPDAILCGNDLIAFGLLDALEEKKVRIPDDVSVTGYDDIPFSKYYKPALTTVHQPTYEMGKTAAEILLKLINGEMTTIEGIVLEPELVVRESTRRK